MPSFLPISIKYKHRHSIANLEKVTSQFTQDFLPAPQENECNFLTFCNLENACDGLPKIFIC